MNTLRGVDFYKRPGIAETLDWSRALLGLDAQELDGAVLEETVGCLLKYRDDIERLKSIGPERVVSGEIEDEEVIA